MMDLYAHKMIDNLKYIQKNSEQRQNTKIHISKREKNTSHSCNEKKTLPMVHSVWKNLKGFEKKAPNHVLTNKYCYG